MRNQMFFPKNDDNIEGIVSLDKPIDYDRKKKVIIEREIKDYDEVYMFIRDHNKMDSGNYTLLPKSEIERFIRLGCYSILMRGEENKKLYGTIFSIPLPIRCSITFAINDEEELTKDKIITHGCTSFLNVHSKLRGFNMCMVLIRDLANMAYENNIYCSYQMTSFKLCDTSFTISSYFRPINLLNSLALGFVFPEYADIKNFHNSRMKYKCKVPKGYSLKRVSNQNMEKALQFYISLNVNKKFVFYPDIKLFSKWIQEFPTYIVSNEKKKVGIFSITKIFSRMGNDVDGNLCLPLIFNATDKVPVLKCLLSVAEERGHDVLYTYSVGDLDEKTLESVNAVETPKKTWFSLYNNSMKLTPKDLYIPLF